jgi:dTDP-4-amino-4,6-dideoxygalactose transaminase
MRRVTSATKLIYVTHFFGWPQEIGELAEWCKKRDLFLVEDCALCLFSSGPHNTIGRTGDAAIYSFVKSLPVPDGGALVLKNKDMWKKSRKSMPPRHRNIFLNSLPLLKKWFMNENLLWQHYEFTRVLLNKSWLKKSVNESCQIEREMPKGNYFDSQKLDWTISRLSKRILNKTDPERIVGIRRRNYQCLHNALHKNVSVELLFDALPEEVCPLSFPVFVKDRSWWVDRLERNGILVGGWPSYHRGFNWKEYPEARYLKNNLLTLPVHQSLDLHQMDYIAECVKSVANEENGHYYSR